MNRAYRRSQLKQQRRKNKEDKMSKTLCNDLSQMFRNCLKGAKQKTELLPCPFCGGEAYIKSYLPYDGYMGESTRYRVGCDSCGVTVEKCTKEHAIDTWNTRTPNEKNDFKEG